VSIEIASFPKLELIQVADVVAREKGIEREEVIEAMEQAIQKAGRSKYGNEHDIQASIDRTSGEISLVRRTQIVDEIEDEVTQITLDQAHKKDETLTLGDYIIDPLPPIDFGRIAAQTAKQVIVQKVREAERSRQYDEFKDRVGEIINGIVKRVEFGNVTLDLGRAEAILRRDELLPRESFRNGDRVRAYIYDVREESRGPQIFVSRTHPEFMKGMFKQEVPEIYDGIIEIKSVARDPGSRAKIGVLSYDGSIDPVGDDPATFVVNALAPAEVSKVVLDEDQKRIEVVVPDEQLSLAIGRRGQNVRLASILSGWDIDILTEAEESERRQEEFKTRSTAFMEALDIDDVIAHLLVAEGFASVQEIAHSSLSDLAQIEGFDEAIGEELQSRASAFSQAEQESFLKRRVELGVTDELAEMDEVTPNMLVVLGENQIKTVDDLGDLASDELMEMVPDAGLSIEDANSIIMAARAHWFEEPQITDPSPEKSTDNEE
jgi:N utilization substance protein A